MNRVKEAWELSVLVAVPKSHYPVVFHLDGDSLQDCINRLKKRCPDGTLLSVQGLKSVVKTIYGAVETDALVAPAMPLTVKVFAPVEEPPAPTAATS